MTECVGEICKHQQSIQNPITRTFRFSAKITMQKMLPLIKFYIHKNRTVIRSDFLRYNFLFYKVVNRI